MEFVSPIKDNDDIQAMKDYLREWNEMYYMLFITGLNTGLRVGDILTLKVKDVQGWHIKLRERKTGKQITRRMTKELKKEMRRYVEDKPFHHFLFKSRQGKIKRSLVSEPIKLFMKQLKNLALIMLAHTQCARHSAINITTRQRT